MPRKLEDNEMVEESKKKRIAANGFRLPDPIRDGEVLTDIKNKKWRLGKSIGLGGFGEIYLASSEIHKPVSKDAKYVVKVEPHNNGPLFVEMNFYIRAAQAEMISSWMKENRLDFLGMPCYIASGSHEYKRERYRFLVMHRYGQDLEKVFLESRRKFHLQTVLHLGIQILNSLEYVHSKDYVHADVKGSNILLSDEPGRVYLVDFGLACRYRKRNGKHKEYAPDERRANVGTPEYTSRDAHIGAHSRRGDLEILGYNMLQWLCSVLPWEVKLSDMEYVHTQKNYFMSNIPSLMRQCFPQTGPPEVIEKYLKYVASLGFETKPDYDYCRELLRQGMKSETFENNGKLLFGLMPVKTCAKNKKSVKRKAKEEPENQGGAKKRVLCRNIARKPCVPQNYNRMTRNNPAPVLRSRQNFSWEKIISGDPEVLLKKKSNSFTRKNPHAGCKHQHHVQKLIQDNANDLDCYTGDSVESTDLTHLSRPTPAMLEVIERRKAMLLGQTVKKWRLDNLPANPSDILTPAMEEVIRKRKTTLSYLADSAIEEQDEDDADDDYDENSFGQRSKNLLKVRRQSAFRMKLRKKKPFNMREWYMKSCSSSMTTNRTSSCSFSSYAPTSDYSSISYSSTSSLCSYLPETNSTAKKLRNRRLPKKNPTHCKAQRKAAVNKSSRVMASRRRYNLRSISEKSVV